MAGDPVTADHVHQIAVRARDAWTTQACNRGRREWGGKQIPPVDDLTWDVLGMVAGRGFGKLLALETPLPTPYGWTTMADIRVGNELFDESGRICRVTYISPVQQEPCFKVTFSDGSVIVAGASHQWVTWTHAERKAFLRSPYEDTVRFPAEWPRWQLKRRIGGNTDLTAESLQQAILLYRSGVPLYKLRDQFGCSHEVMKRNIEAGLLVLKAPQIEADSPGPQIRTTEQIAATLRFGKRSDLNHCIPQCGALQLEELSVPVPPYVLGAWLGDGHASVGRFTVHQDDMAHLEAALESEGYHTNRPKDPQGLATRGLTRDLRAAGVLNHKHVPLPYLRASERQRLALLRGLMDTDGGVDTANSCSFTNTNKQLVDAVYELVISLGMKATRDDRIPKCQTGCGERAYRVIFSPTRQVFTLPRKARQLVFDGAQALRRHHRMIVSVERTADVPLRCITVDSRHSTYLAGHAMIPTHNTSALVQFAWWECYRVPGIIGHAVSPTLGDLWKTLYEGPAGFRATVPPECLKGGNWEEAKKGKDHSIEFANGSRILGFGATDEGGRLRGPQCHFAIGDELREWDRPPGNLEQVLNNLLLGIRLPYPDGTPSRLIFGTTPRRIAYLTNFYKRKGVRIVRGTTYENIQNLSRNFLNTVMPLEGTKLGKAEIHGLDTEDEEGGILQRSWFRLWPAGKKLPEFSFILVSLDTGYEEKDFDRKSLEPDPTGCQVWGVFNTRQCFTEQELRHVKVKGRYAALLCDCWDEHLGFPELLERIRGVYRQRYGQGHSAGGPGRHPDIILIENKGAGISLRQALAKYSVPAWPFNPRNQSKTLRLNVAAPYVLQGNFWLPESSRADRKGLPRDWCEPFLEQVCAFNGPGSTRHDEHVDCLSQAAIYMAEQSLLTIAPQSLPDPDPEERKARDEAEAQAIAERDRPRENPYG